MQLKKKKTKQKIGETKVRKHLSSFTCNSLSDRERATFLSGALELSCGRRNSPQESHS